MYHHLALLIQNSCTLVIGSAIVCVCRTDKANDEERHHRGIDFNAQVPDVVSDDGRVEVIQPSFGPSAMA